MKADNISLVLRNFHDLPQFYQFYHDWKKSPIRLLYSFLVSNQNEPGSIFKIYSKQYFEQNEGEPDLLPLWSRNLSWKDDPNSIIPAQQVQEYGSWLQNTGTFLLTRKVRLSFV